MLPEDLIGQTLGHYRILEPLGYGGTATVFLAQDIHLQRNVAVKVFQPGGGDPKEFLRRFAREARVLAQLDHPHILPVYDYGEQDGIAYLVMQHMAGGSLRDRVRGKGPMPPEEVVQLINQILNALEYAHEHGLIHRDIKPGNMLFKADGTLMLSDFGLVKVTRLDTLPSLEEASTITTQAITGTPDYMAPEQIAGHVTPASDIYALGIVLYEMLTGARPFKSENYVGLLMKHMYEQPRPLREVNAAISRTLDAVVLRAMEKDPEKRYQHPLELRKALEEGITAQLAGIDVDEEDDEEGGATAKLIDEMGTTEMPSGEAEDEDEDNVPTATLPSLEPEATEAQDQVEDHESNELSSTNANEADTNSSSVVRKTPRSASKRASRAARKAVRVASMQRRDADLVAALAAPMPKPLAQTAGVISSPNPSAPEQSAPVNPPAYKALAPSIADKDVAGAATQEVAPAQDVSAEAAADSKGSGAEVLATSKVSSIENPEQVESSKVETTAREKAPVSSGDKVLRAEEPAMLTTPVFPLPQRTRKPLVASLSLFSIILVIGLSTFFVMRANNPTVLIQKTPIVGVQTPLATTTAPATTATVSATEVPSPVVTSTATPLPASTDCPAPGTANKANTPALNNTGTNANIVYFVNDPASNTAILKRYDTQSSKTSDISKMSSTIIQEAQLSADGQWVLFVATIANRPQLRIVRMDGQGMQALYCAPTNGTIYSSQWSTNQDMIVFNATNTSTAPAAPMTFLLDATTGIVRVAVQPSGKLSVRPITWLNDNQVYMMQENHASPNTPLQNIYLYDINQGTNLSINALKKLSTVSTKACASFDTSLDGTLLFVNTCTISASGQQAPSKITSQPAAGTTSSPVYTDSNLIITALRTAKANTLLLIAQNASDPSKNSLYTLNTDGTGLKQLTTPDPGTLESVNEFSQYVWSNVSRDKTLYAVESLSQGNVKLFFGSLDGTKAPKQFASTTGANMKLVGWTVV